MFTNINMFDYIRTVKLTEQIINDRTAPAKFFGLVTIKKPKTNHYTNVDIILQVTKTTKQNKSNITQTLQPI